mgnify:CR=1 FL=1
MASGNSHAVFLEDDVLLSQAAGRLLADNSWIPADVAVVKLEHYGPRGQRVLLNGFRAVAGTFRIGRMLSRHTGAAAYILSRGAAEFLLSQTRFALPVDGISFRLTSKKILMHASVPFVHGSRISAHFTKRVDASKT